MSFVDSICVKIINESMVLQAKGNKLILHVVGNKLEHKQPSKQHICEVLLRDKIHQISYIHRGHGQKNQIVCSAAAGRFLLFTKIIGTTFTNSFVVQMTDWISSIKVMDDGSVVIMTCHSFAVLLEVTRGRAVIKAKLQCEENSTLYCSHIHGQSWEELLFFNGSALGELIVWKKQGKRAERRSQIIYQNFLHNGVILSIDYNGSYLVTSSDDRSIKIFDVISSNEQFELVEKHQLFGHTSRVFVCKIINFNNKINFLSAGEDSNFCIWSEKGDLLSKKNVNSSGILWNLDYSEKLDTVITCSSTGMLNKFFLCEILFEKHFQESISSDKKVHVVKLKWMDNGALVAIDNNMEVHVKTRMKGWSLVKHPLTTLKYIDIEISQNRVYLAAKSSIVIFDFSEHLQILHFTTEIKLKDMLPSMNFDFLRSIHPVGDEVFCSDASGSCFVINVNERKIMNQFIIPKCFEPWTTSVARIDNFWLVADRVGNFYLYKGDGDLNSSAFPVQKLTKLHGKLGVTAIKVEHNGFIKTTGSDRTVKTLFLNRALDTPTIEIHHCEKTSVNWVEKIYNWKGRDYLFGFNDNYFTIEHNRQVLYEHRCGGRHRCWDISLVDKDGIIVFAYIQNKQLNFVEFMLSDFEFEGNDIMWHTKDCNAIEMACSDNLMISGGEDTLLKVTSIKIIDGEAKFEDVATINSHISSIKALATFQADDDELWIISAGGRAQIVITRLKKLKDAKEEVNYMLTNSLENGNSKNSTFDPETRFTSICYDKASRMIYVACSDGFIRVFKLDKCETNSFALNVIAEHFYGKCVLKIAMIENFILTMATDGYICFWNYDELSHDLKFIDKLKHNQSGINCCDIFKCSDGAFLVGTSGDDATIFISELTIDKEKVNVLETILTNEIHIAQVTGLKFTSRFFLFTTSIDQTICKLEIKDKSIKIVDKMFTCISDVKGFVFLKQSHFAVFGAGLEILKRTF